MSDYTDNGGALALAGGDIEADGLFGAVDVEGEGDGAFSGGWMGRGLDRRRAGTLDVERQDFNRQAACLFECFAGGYASGGVGETDSAGGVSVFMHCEAMKFVPRKMDHHLSKDETAGIHPSLSKTFERDRPHPP